MGVTLNVNGVPCSTAASPSDSLLWVLRDDLGLVSAKYGCGIEQCGACRVLVDGTPTASCGVLVGDVGARSITTLEGARDDPMVSAVRDAILSINAGQCGYCLPGILITLTALVRDRHRAGRSTDVGADADSAASAGDRAPDTADTADTPDTDASASDRAAVLRALDAHLCRCGSQPRIIEAALAALRTATNG